MGAGLGVAIAALVSGIASLFLSNAQHSQNVDDWNMQNQYNENMYNRYNSPYARVEEMKKAGMSDSAIGAALSGFSGSGTTIQSSPLQPNSIGDAFSSMFGNMNETLNSGVEREKGREETKLTRKQQEVADATRDKIVEDAEWTKRQSRLFDYTWQDLVDKVGFEKDSAKLNLEKIEKELKKLDNEIKSAEAQGRIDKWMADYCEKHNMPYNPNTNSGMVQDIKNVIVTGMESISDLNEKVRSNKVNNVDDFLDWLSGDGKFKIE